MTASSMRVPVAPLRAAFARSGMTYAQVARALECDHATVARILGTQGQYVYRTRWTGERVRLGPYARKTVTYENAVRFAAALGVDPFEVGV